MEFRDLINSSPVDSRDNSEEARFSFIQGGYVEEFDCDGRSLGLMGTVALSYCFNTSPVNKECYSMNLSTV